MDRRVLIVCGQEIISERNDGGKKCSYRNYELFCQVFGKENVYLVMFTNNYPKREGNILRFSAYKTVVGRAVNILRGTLFTSAANEQKVVDFIKENNINIVLFERSMYGSLIKRIKRQKLSCEIWVFVHNIERRYFENKVKHQGFLFYFPYLKIRKSENITFQYADYVITLTQRDSSFIKDIYGKQSELILPMTFYDTFDIDKISTRNSEDTRELLFIGTMFPPNYDGIKWFVENVMPELEDYHLTIVGKNFELKEKELVRRNVSVVGSVEQLEEYYYKNNVMVMPIFYGDGMKIKTAEAMMFGKTILATDEALEGYETDDVSGIYRCNTKEEFVNTIKRVYSTGGNGFQNDVRQLYLSRYCLNNQIGECKDIWDQSRIRFSQN